VSDCLAYPPAPPVAEPRKATRDCARCAERSRQDGLDICRKCLNAIRNSGGRWSGAPSNGQQVERSNRVKKEQGGQGGQGGSMGD
jgi:hypothetical protein